MWVLSPLIKSRRTLWWDLISKTNSKVRYMQKMMRRLHMLYELCYDNAYKGNKYYEGKQRLFMLIIFFDLIIYHLSSTSSLHFHSIPVGNAIIEFREQHFWKAWPLLLSNVMIKSKDTFLNVEAWSNLHYTEFDQFMIRRNKISFLFHF